MKVIDPGHVYELASLDGDQLNRLVFVKREGPKYPGNKGAHPGTNMQEVLRAMIDRCLYLQDQQPCWETATVISLMANCVQILEARAARLHGREPPDLSDSVAGSGACLQCGHVGCDGRCR